MKTGKEGSFPQKRRGKDRTLDILLFAPHLAKKIYEGGSRNRGRARPDRIDSEIRRMEWKKGDKVFNPVSFLIVLPVWHFFLLPPRLAISVQV